MTEKQGTATYMYHVLKHANMYNSNTKRKILSHLVTSCKALPEYSVISYVRPPVPQLLDPVVTKSEREAIPFPFLQQRFYKL